MYTTQVREHGMLPSTGTVGDSYDNAMAESVNGAYKTELVWRRKPFADLAEPELATFRWVSWWNSKRLHQSLGCRTPEQIETEYHANQAAQLSHNKRGTEIRPLQAASSRSSCSAAADSTYTYHNQEPNPRKQQKPLNSSIPPQRSHHGIRTPTRVCVHDSSNEPYPPLDGRLQYRDAMR